LGIRHEDTVVVMNERLREPRTEVVGTPEEPAVV